MGSMVHRVLLAMTSSFWSQWCNISYGGAGLFISFAVIVVGAISWHILRKESLALPPGPRGMPVLGNLPFLHPDLHNCFAKKKYGPVMRFWLDKDAIFVDRDTPIAMLMMTYGGFGLIWARYELAHASEEVWDSMRRIYANTSTLVNVNEHTFSAMINVITSMLWGRTLEDIFPVLAPLDKQGKNSKMKKLGSRLDQIFDFVINHHEVKGLSMEGIENKDREHKDLLQIFLAVEWTMAELMNKPEKMERAQKELEQVVGMNDMVEETHLPKLPFLNAVIKEVLRLHPPGPFLVPRRTREPCVLRGYTIPSGTQVLVNAWAIHRDPEFWDSPSEFQPERFLSRNLKCDYSGNDFRYLPFGSGRRICAGLQCYMFDWRLPDGVNGVDLTEKFDLVLRKATPFIVIPKPRLSNLDLYT
ncbi:hypothetical protein AAG906_012041 [Vitis piasezkii]